MESLKLKNDYRLRERRLNLGMAIRQIKDRDRTPLKAIAERSGINRNTLNTLLQMEEMNTSQERFLKLTESLNVPADEIIRIARETAHYNFFHLKQGGGYVFKYRTQEVEVYSPPCFSRKDFLWCHVRILPGKSIADLVHETMDQVAGFVTHGHLGLKYGDKSYVIHTNQSFFFDPKILHSFENQLPSGNTEFYLLYQLKPLPSEKQQRRGRKMAPTPISTAGLIEEIRKELSPDPNRLLPMPTLAYLAGIELDALVHLRYRKTKIIPFEKLDLLANLTDYSFEHIIQKAQHQYKGWVSVFTDQDKVALDLSLRYGVRFTSQTGIGVGRRKFTIADMSFESWKEGQGRREWAYRGIGFVGIAVQRGCLAVQYGRQPLKILKWGETLYMNADVELIMYNALSEEKAKEAGESSEAKALIFSCPPLI